MKTHEPNVWILFNGQQHKEQANDPLIRYLAIRTLDIVWNIITTLGVHIL